jgi:hypothetical protein
MTDLHLDGNGVAGLLGEILAVEPTAIARVCQACGDEQPLANHRAYRGAGVVLRCPSCEAMAIRIGLQDERLTIDWHGTYRVG